MSYLEIFGCRVEYKVLQELLRKKGLGVKLDKRRGENLRELRIDNKKDVELQVLAT